MPLSEHDMIFFVYNIVYIICRSIADKRGVTPGQLTLAWVLGQGDDFFAIPGTKKSK
jgi:aryl-alcohol dehydrogenase-like predicted oxidoreductase